ncbi:MAG: DUF3108 domain-containing protein [Pseudolabrys sp.]|nr:DUF3108 domain-containing protein [Pseudolabrys sp.]
MHRQLIAAAVVLAGAGAWTPGAHAQTRLDAEYTAYLSGLPIGKGSWVIDVDDSGYSATASGAATGLIKIISGGQGSSSGQGNFNGTSTYSTTVKTSHKTDEIALAVVNGVAKDIRVNPPTDPDPERVPVSEAMKQGIVDPMTASLVRVAGTGELVTSEACARSASIFDGRLRYDLKLAFKRMDKVKSDRGYVGPVVVCAVYFTPVAGHVPSRAAIKHLAASQDMEVWLAPISGTRFLAPYRFQVPTPIGLGKLEADQFVVTAQPPRKAAKTQ